MTKCQQKTYTTEIEFKTNLTKFVTEARAKGAQPVLLTPVAERKFDLSGKIEGTHEVYSQIVRDGDAGKSSINWPDKKLRNYISNWVMKILNCCLCI